MKNKDWNNIEELFHTVVSLSVEERAAYLDRACREDASLRAEVESLISALENKHEFMEQPAFSLGMKVLSEESTEESLIEKQVGSYKILKLLGKGGMGEVYLAEDARLDRKVALKFLSNRFIDDAWAKRQLMKEAQAVARLDHSNICAVYGFEEYDGLNFMVMQYIEGEALACLIREKLLEPEHILRLAIQIVSALAEAHSHGIIHRDIKPQNIMVAANGQVKVLDFGLAKFVQQRQGALSAPDSESQSSQLGLVLGTVAYMSPEQLRAERLDFRSDVFSFGIVLYEMIGGRNPYFCGSNAEIISAILTSEPPPLTNLAQGIPSRLARIAQKCLKKDREHRYQSASELLLHLDNPQMEITSREALLKYLNLRSYAVLALLILLIITVSILYLRPTRSWTLAVLPIVTMSDDAEAVSLSGTLREDIVNKLSGLSNLQIKAPTVVPAYENRGVARQKVGQDFNVDAALFGTLAPQGEFIMLQFALVNAANGSLIWQEEYKIKPAEALALQGELSNKIISKLQLSLSGDEKRLLSAGQTENAEAYKMYVRGRYFWSKRRDKNNIQKAIGFFKQAIELDPAYAKAYAGLADCYILRSTVAYGALPMEEARSGARYAAAKALELDPLLCEAHASMAMYQLRYEWNWQEAEREFNLAISLNPSYAPAYFGYSNLLALTGRLNEAIAKSETAKKLDPFSPVSGAYLGLAFYRAGRYDEAAYHINKALREEPELPAALYFLGYVYQQQGRYKESIDSLEKVYSNNKLLAAAPLGYSYARIGRRDKAQEMLDQLEELSKREIVPSQEKAIIYVGLDDKDRAFMLL